MSKFKPRERVNITSPDGSKEFVGTVISYNEFNDPDVAYAVHIDDFCDVLVSEKQLSKLEEK